MQGPCGHRHRPATRPITPERVWRSQRLPVPASLLRPEEVQQDRGAGWGKDPWVAGHGFSLAGASQQSEEINRLLRNPAELSVVKFLPLISIQVRNVFVS